MIYYIFVGILFLYCSVQDIRRKEIGNIGLIAGMGIVVLLLLLDGMVKGNLLSTEALLWKQLWGILPGICVWILSHVTRGAIGRGDGYLLCVSGLALGVEANVAILFYGLLAAGLSSAVLLALRKVKRKTKLPFVPFLCGGYLILLLQFL